MNALVQAPTDRLPAHAIEPPMPPDLARHVAAVAEPSRYDGLVVAQDAPRWHAAAGAALAAYEAMLHTPDPRAILAWMTRLARGVRNPPAEADFRARCAAVAEACADLPTAVWTAATLTEAQRTMPWWPSVADVDAFLRPKAEALSRKRDALRRIASAPRPGEQPAPEPREPPTNAAREAVRALAAQFRAERSWNHPNAPQGRPPVRAIPLHPDHLAALRNSNPAIQAARALRDGSPAPRPTAPPRTSPYAPEAGDDPALLDAWEDYIASGQADAE